jgi:hypothetical protein
MSNTTATTTTTKKITKREKFEMLMTIAEVKANPILSEFIERELELLAKKNSAEKKPTPKNEKNEVIRAAILDALSDGTAMTITDMLKNIPECADITNQHCSSIVRVLKEEQIVERFEEKRKAYFRMK